ncbi:aldose sugar dehydrogenase YliI-like [Ylistrum balloti]|uniref:aldose sugar dehydrogenase YliI-like n=1 Tax=Ylistrum balloti TaxID=509963 RepID=UPI002905C5A6|nr:aldose sugar dehydrogenase YliI-like [Ylistrum balloti]
MKIQNKLISVLLLMVFVSYVVVTSHATPRYTKGRSSALRYTQEAQGYSILVEELYSTLNHPWGITWYISSDSKAVQHPMIVTERNGSVWLLVNEKIKKITKLPRDVVQSGQGGWLDVVQGPNNIIYLSYSKGKKSSNVTALISFELREKDIHSNTTTIQARKVRSLYKMNKTVGSQIHFGGMLALGERKGNDAIFLGLGERGQRNQAQNLDSDHGTIVAIPIEKKGKHEIISYGHRNPQGMYYDPLRALLYSTEHGPKGGDELNLIHMNSSTLPNYGWPVVSYGKEYSSGLQVGEGTSKKGMEEPLHYWEISPALSGLTVYYGKAFPEWNGDLFASALKFQQIFHVDIDDEGKKVLDVKPILKRRIGRIRSIRQGPDTNLYFITDENRGKIFKISRE